MIYYLIIWKFGDKRANREGKEMKIRKELDNIAGVYSGEQHFVMGDSPSDWARG